MQLHEGGTRMTNTQIPITQAQLNALKAENPGNPQIQALTLADLAAGNRIQPIDSAEQLETFKSAFPMQPDVQALTLAQVQERAKAASIDWNQLVLNPPRVVLGRMPFSPCETAIASVVIDIVMIAIGASGLADKITGETVENVAGVLVRELGEDVTELDKMIQAVKDAETDWAKAKAVFSLLSALKDFGCLGAVIAAIFKSLSWWDMILYGLTALATIIALVATDGVALIAEVAILAMSGAFLIEDIETAVCKCTAPTPTPTPSHSPVPPVAQKGALCSWTGNYMTIVNGGAIGDKVAALNTDHPGIVPNAVFTWVSIDPNTGTFALLCPDGVHYLTANKGGGIGGPNNHEAPVHADATEIGNWETLTLVGVAGNKIAIESCDQYYVTAVNGGGWTDPTRPFRTDATAIGPWETFTFVQF
jgi:hypothetical protein